MSNLIQNLADEVLPHAPWEAIAPHFARDVVVCVTGISLAEAGAALAKDDVPTVQRWLADGVLRRPTDDDAQEWTDSDATFDILVIDPWVLVTRRNSSE